MMNVNRSKVLQTGNHMSHPSESFKEMIAKCLTLLTMTTPTGISSKKLGVGELNPGFARTIE